MKFGAGMLRTTDGGDVISWVLTKNTFNSKCLIVHLNPPEKRLRKIAQMKGERQKS